MGKDIRTYGGTHVDTDHSMVMAKINQKIGKPKINRI